MADRLDTIIFPVKDLAQAKALYGTLLGTQPAVDQPYYVGFEVQGQQIGLDPHGHSRGMTGPIGYWSVDDIERSLKALVDAGAQPKQPVTDVGGGKLIASVEDADGNVIGLMQPPAGG